MIKKPMNWENVQEFGDREKLPLGAYVCKIKQAKVMDNSYGSQLGVLFDIAEGEYAGHYNRDYQGNQNPDKKWKGVLRLWLPKDDGSDKDETTKRVLKGFVTAVEKSNPGYAWDWNENSLAGKMIGILMRNEEWEWQDKHGWTVRPFRAMSVDTVHEGNYKLPDDKPLKNGGSAPVAPANVPAGYTEVPDDDFPF